MTEKEIMEKLSAPFEVEISGVIYPDLKWLPSHKVGKDKIECVPYVSGEQVRNRLNEVLGTSWTSRLEKHEDRTICTISVRMSNGEWIDRADVGTKTAIEGQKGEATDAIKRAAKNWGVGAYVDKVPSIIMDSKRIDGKTVVVTPKGTILTGDDLNYYINASMSLPMAKLISLWKALSDEQKKSLEKDIVKIKDIISGKKGGKDAGSK